MKIKLNSQYYAQYLTSNYQLKIGMLLCYQTFKDNYCCFCFVFVIFVCFLVTYLSCLQFLERSILVMNLQILNLLVKVTEKKIFIVPLHVQSINLLNYNVCNMLCYFFARISNDYEYLSIMSKYYLIKSLNKTKKDIMR